MYSKSAIIVVVDRLSASYLGPYGNTWVETPELNRLASESSLFEFALSNSPDLANTYGSYWLGGSENGNLSLSQRLVAAGIQTILVSDDAQVSDHVGASGFEQQETVEHPRRGVVSDVMQTRIARLFSRAVEVLAGADSPFLLWVHASGLGTAWDAPYEYREQFADEDDPPPPDIVVPPAAVLAPNYDPDDLWGYARAYAGQILVLDACCGALLDALKNSEHADSTLLMLTSPRGFPLGEHRRIGACEPALYSELLHVPWFLRHPQLDGATVRRHALVQPSDLFATLLAWFDLDDDPTMQNFDLLRDASDPEDAIRTHIVARSPQPSSSGPGDNTLSLEPLSEIAIRTKHWFYRRAASGENELYAKPDDRFEANEVAARCGDIITSFEQFAADLDSGTLPENISL